MKMFMRASALVVFLFSCLAAQGQQSRPDTLYVSAEHVVHLVCPAEITDVEVSNPDVVYTRILDNNANMVGLLAFEPFSTPTSLMVVDGTGKVYVYFLSYRELPDELVRFAGTSASAPEGGAAAAARPADGSAPQGSALSVPDLVGDAGAFKGARITHVGHHEFGVEVVCDRLYVQGDHLVFRFRVINRSGISYEIDNVTFLVERGEGGGRRKHAVMERSEVPVREDVCKRTEPDSESYSAFVFNKFSLRKAERFYAFFNEVDGTGTRSFELEFTPDDINRVIRRQQ